MKLSLEHIDPESKVIVGVSGGADSVALLHLFLESGWKHLVVAHVNHQLREDSDMDEELTKHYADVHQLPFELLKADVRREARKNGKGLEESGRSIRYNFFSELRKKHQADYIATAHHADDQVETILLNIVRGTGLKGLVGMEAQHGVLLRPLLPYSKADVLDYCGKRRLRFVDESSNTDLRYRRNFLRHSVIPYLKQMNPSLLSTFELNRNVWKKASDYFHEQARQFLLDHQVGERAYDLRNFQSLHTLTKLEVLRELYITEHGNLNNFQQRHMDQILLVLHSETGNKRKEFGPGKMLLKRSGAFEIVADSRK